MDAPEKWNLESLTKNDLKNHVGSPIFALEILLYYQVLHSAPKNHKIVRVNRTTRTMDEEFK
jgi:hypothetical protein